MRDAGARALLVLAPLLWGGNFVVGRALHASVDPFSLNYLRWVVAAAALLPVIYLHRKAVRQALQLHGFQLFLLSLLSIVGFNWLLYEGLARMPGSIAGIIFGLTPFLIILVSRLWRGRALLLREAIGGACALTGLVLILADPHDLQQPFGLVGPAFILSAGLAWAIYTVASRRFAIALPPLAFLSTTVWIGLVVMSPIAIVAGVSMPSGLSALELSASALYLGLGASILAFWSWQAGVATLGPVRSSIYLQLIPVFSTVLAAIFIGEALTLTKVQGLFAVAIGVLLAQRGLSGSAINADAQRD